MQNGQRRSWSGIVALVVITALISSGMTAFLLTGELVPFWRLPFGQPVPGRSADLEPFELLNEVRAQLQAYFAYPERVQDDLLEAGAIEGMIEVLNDPYTAYFTPEEYAELMADMDETYSGVGIRVEWSEEGYVTIVNPIPGSPGEAAGLQTGDRIVEVDGESLHGLTLEQTVGRIKGPVGTAVRLTVERDGERFEVTVVRATIETPTLEYAMISSDIGYIRLWEFNRGIHSRLDSAVKDLRQQGMQGFVLDLRQNPGGLMDEAIKVADYLLPAGDIVRYEPTFAEPYTYRATGEGLDLPFVVLVDQYSASASEIVAGAIKDRGAAPIVGEKTFGKGIIQSILPLENGGGLKVTSARYLTPSGQDIHGVGIEPDVTVPMQPGESLRPLDVRDPERNTQMAKAVELLQSEMARRGQRAGNGR